MEASRESVYKKAQSLRHHIYDEDDREAACVHARQKAFAALGAPRPARQMLIQVRDGEEDLCDHQCAHTECENSTNQLPFGRGLG
eukprot:3466322-Prymnesium_polylepis.3